jgi:hypothetical protein
MLSRKTCLSRDKYSGFLAHYSTLTYMHDGLPYPEWKQLHHFSQLSLATFYSSPAKRSGVNPWRGMKHTISCARGVLFHGSTEESFHCRGLKLRDEAEQAVMRFDAREYRYIYGISDGIDGINPDIKRQDRLRWAQQPKTLSLSHVDLVEHVMVLPSSLRSHRQSLFHLASTVLHVRKEHICPRCLVKS